MTRREPVAVFDIGGTFARSALLDADDKLHFLAARPTPSWVSQPGERTAALQERLIGLLTADARRLACRGEVSLAGVSLGTAIDARSGLVLGSGPLWGAGSDLQFNVTAALERAAPEFRWSVVNDLRANAVALAALPENRAMRRLAAVGVGSGLGLRTIEVRTGRVPTSADSGLQGEIGHLPASFSLNGRKMVLKCDCGAPGHLSAYASGRGLNRLLDLLAAEGAPWLAGDAPLLEQFNCGLASGRPEARHLLDAITRPLARTLLSVLAIDADVERIYLSGGVPFALGTRYLDSLLGHMESVGLYGRAGTLRGKIRIADPDGEIGLRGAGLLARAQLGGAACARRWVVPGDEPKSYDIMLTPRLLDPHQPALRAAVRLDDDDEGTHHRLVICDARVWDLYAEPIERALRGGPGRLDIETLALDLGEAGKGLPAVCTVADAFERFGLRRRSEPVLAIGGGVLLDVVGFTASLYRRGVPYVKVPTTLLAMIDAAVGVKTGINYGGAKSRLGTYYLPSSVLIDPAFVRTLDARQYRVGLAESVKIALVADPHLFALLEEHSRSLGAGAPDRQVEADVLERSVTAMVGELTGNLCEDRLERLVDIGHTFSGALETCLQPPLLHGEGVAIDLALTVMLSEGRGMLDAQTATRIVRVFTALGLPIIHPGMSLDLLLNALADTTLHRDGHQRIPLLRDVGSAVFVSDVTRSELDRALRALQARHALRARQARQAS